MMKPMSWSRSAVSVMSAIAMHALVVSEPSRANDEQRTVIDGRCQYPDRVVKYRDEAALILCDTLTISRGGTSTTMDFSQRSWGSMARFTGVMLGDKMSVSHVSLRQGAPVSAAGNCEIFHQNNGRISVVSCLAKAGSRSMATNFVPLRL